MFMTIKEWWRSQTRELVEFKSYRTHEDTEDGRMTETCLSVKNEKRLTYVQKVVC
jgi:hypothetical protein